MLLVGASQPVSPRALTLRRRVAPVVPLPDVQHVRVRLLLPPLGSSVTKECGAGLWAGRLSGGFFVICRLVAAGQGAGWICEGTPLRENSWVIGEQLSHILCVMRVLRGRRCEAARSLQFVALDGLSVARYMSPIVQNSESEGTFGDGDGGMVGEKGTCASRFPSTLFFVSVAPTVVAPRALCTWMWNSL